MKRHLAVLTGLILLATAGEVDAQLFGGTRRVGTPLYRRSGADASAEVGSIRGNERFVRGNRRRTDFVGKDTRDAGKFVGLEQGTSTGQVQSATAGLRIETEEEANVARQSAAQQPAAIYDPRLTVGFDFTPPSEEATAQRLAKRLAATPQLQLLGPVEVSVQGETATLRGQAASQRDRGLAALVLLLEPGVSEVRNNLSVAPSPAASPGPPGEPAKRPDSSSSSD